jgi:hypothetical protein
MALRDDIATDAQAAWFDTDGLAQTVIYTQPARESGEAKVVTDIPAIISYGENPKDEGRFHLAEMTAFIPAAAIAQPRKDGDTITVAGVVWRVRRVRAGDALEISWMLECSRDEQATKLKWQ